MLEGWIGFSKSLSVVCTCAVLLLTADRRALACSVPEGACRAGQAMMSQSRPCSTASCCATAGHGTQLRPRHVPHSQQQAGLRAAQMPSLRSGISHSGARHSLPQVRRCGGWPRLCPHWPGIVPASAAAAASYDRPADGTSPQAPEGKAIPAWNLRARWRAWWDLKASRAHSMPAVHKWLLEVTGSDLE